jgi:hypothetical protein
MSRFCFAAPGTSSWGNTGFAMKYTNCRVQCIPRFIGASVGVCLAITWPARADTCHIDSDCERDNLCVKDGGECEAGANCVSKGATNLDGVCEPSFRVCDGASDCPDGLACKSGPDGKCTVAPGATPSCTPGQTVCTLVQPTCGPTRACPDGYECLVSAVHPCATVKGEKCSESDRHVCVPTRSPCTADGKCQTGAVCFALAESRQDVPEAWDRTNDHVCLSEPIVFALRGYAAIEGAGFGDVVSDDSSQTEKSTPAQASGVGCSVAEVDQGWRWQISWWWLLPLGFLATRSRLSGLERNGRS